MSKGTCADTTHKKHDGISAQYARVLKALQWAVNFCDPLSIRSEEEWQGYRNAHLLAWGIEPALKKSDVLGDADDIVKI